MTTQGSSWSATPGTRSGTCAGMRTDTADGVEQVPDGLGRVRERADGLGNRTLFEYDGEGLLTRKTTPQGACDDLYLQRIGIARGGARRGLRRVALRV